MKSVNMKQIIQSDIKNMRAVLAFLVVTAFLVPVISLAGGIAGGDPSAGGLGDFISGVVQFINQILIPAVLALAFLFFVWGVFLYFVKGGADDEAQGKGKQLMLYSIGGFVLILIFFGVVTLLANAIGLEGQNLGATPGIEI